MTVIKSEAVAAVPATDPFDDCLGVHVEANNRRLNTPTSLPVQEERVREIVTRLRGYAHYKKLPFCADAADVIEQLAFRDKPTEPTRSPECDREAIARIINPMAFDPYANATHLRADAYAKADAILAKPTPQDSDKTSGEALTDEAIIGFAMRFYDENDKGYGADIRYWIKAVRAALSRTDAPSISEGGA